VELGNERVRREPVGWERSIASTDCELRPNGSYLTLSGNKTVPPKSAYRPTHLSMTGPFIISSQPYAIPFDFGPPPPTFDDPKEERIYIKERLACAYREQLVQSIAW